MNVKHGFAWTVFFFLCMTFSHTEGVSSRPKRSLDNATIRQVGRVDYSTLRPKQSLKYNLLRPKRSFDHVIARPKRSVDSSRLHPNKGLKESLIRPKRNIKHDCVRSKRSFDHARSRRPRNVTYATFQPKRSLGHAALIAKESFNQATIRPKRNLDHATSRPKRSLHHAINRPKRSIDHAMNRPKRSLDQAKSRPKRDLSQFGDMVELQTGIDRHLFNGYGNYCGLLGKGIPVDPIDSCCYGHDMCYYVVNRAQCKGAFGLAAFTRKYTWLQNLHNGDITCEASGYSCSAALCRCDKMTAKCFAQTKHTYNAGWQRSSLGAVLSSRPVFTPL